MNLEYHTGYLSKRKGDEVVDDQFFIIPKKIDLINTNSIFDIIVFKNNLSSTNNVYVDIFYENN